MARARTLLVAGTASHVGKSTVAAGLCRLLADRGVDVAPFKAQNMSNNARVARTPDGAWGEIGVSQYVQARAARVAPTTDANPVLLKPRGDGESQLVVDGEAVAHLSAGEYYGDRWRTAREAAAAAHSRLARDHDVVIAEGAGSIAEINLRDRDLANLEAARFADADVMLIADIERGGAFASLVGTLDLMPADVRRRVVGVAITKFRGDRSVLDPGIEELEARTGIPVLGVLPYDDPELPEEDSVSLPAGGGRAVLGDDDGVSAERTVTVAVPRLPRISNFTDLEPLAAEPGVRVSIRPLDASVDDADAVVLPGSKNTVDDLLALRGAGWEAKLRAFDGPIVGVCGGFQMLGRRLSNASVESAADDRSEVAGFGLLPVETEFVAEKDVRWTELPVEGVGPLGGASGVARGYEIHAGRSELVGEAARPLGESSAAAGRVLGTYLHGLFENDGVRNAFVDNLFEARGVTRPAGGAPGRSPFEAAAELVGDHLELDPIVEGD